MLVLNFINLCMFMFAVAWRLWRLWRLWSRCFTDFNHKSTWTVDVSREEVLDGARRGFRRATFKNTHMLTVKFSGEAGIDDGGPTREFMRLALKAMHDSHLFEGPNNCKVLAVNIAGK